MRRIAGGLCEVVHVLATALLFGWAALLTALTAPPLAEQVFGLSAERASRLFHDVAELAGGRFLWPAGAALVFALLAPYVRGDGKRVIAWLRIVLAGAVIVVGLTMTTGVTKGSRERQLEADVESRRPAAESLRWRSDRGLTPWNAFFLATGLNLLLGAFQVTGGAAKKAE